MWNFGPGLFFFFFFEASNGDWRYKQEDLLRESRETQCPCMVFGGLSEQQLAEAKPPGGQHQRSPRTVPLYSTPSPVDTLCWFLPGFCLCSCPPPIMPEDQLGMWCGLETSTYN